MIESVLGTLFGSKNETDFWEWSKQYSILLGWLKIELKKYSDNRVVRRLRKNVKSCILKSHMKLKHDIFLSIVRIITSNIYGI